MKPSKAEVLRWIKLSLNSLIFAENAFLNVVLRASEETNGLLTQNELEQSENPEEVSGEGEEVDGYEVVDEDDDDFECLD